MEDEIKNNIIKSNNWSREKKKVECSIPSGLGRQWNE